MTTTAIQNDRLNGINLNQLHQVVEDVKQDAAAGSTRWGVTTRWVNGAVSETEVTGYQIGARRVSRSFKFRCDEPLELGGTNTYPNPQEYLLGALNACMVVGYAALSSLHGITLESVEIQTRGEIDLRGFLGLDPKVKPGYDELHYTVRIKGSGTEAQFREIHETVMRTSPNRFNLAAQVALTSELVIE